MCNICCLPKINLDFVMHCKRMHVLAIQICVHLCICTHVSLSICVCVCVCDGLSCPTCPCLILSPALPRFYLPQLCESLEDLQNVNGQLRTEGQAIWSMMGGILGQVWLTFNRLILSLPCPSSFHLSPPHPILDPTVRLIYHSSSELTAHPDTNASFKHSD